MVARYFALQLTPELAKWLVLVAAGWCVFRRPLRRFGRGLGFGCLAAVLVSPLALGPYPTPHPPSSLDFRLPLDGPVTVLHGGTSRWDNYHVVYPDQCGAYDLGVTKNGITHRGDGKQLQDYYVYGEPVRAPAAGTVRSVDDGHPEQAPGVMGGSPAGGNEVVLEVAPAQFLFLGHMQPGSLRVKRGQRVREGDVVGLAGNSGNTSEPHLHIHLQDTPRFNLGEGIPLYFSHYRLDGRVVERGMPTGGMHRQVVENVPKGIGPASSPPMRR
jgi:hypothetical protein